MVGEALSLVHSGGARRIGRAIRDALPDAPIRLVDWTQANSAFFAAVQVERNVMFLILTLIILVAVINLVAAAATRVLAIRHR